MKTSKKILIGVAALVLLVLITGLFLLRNDLKILQTMEASQSKFKAVPVSGFSTLDFSGHWSVIIKQGDECKVEVEEDSLWKVKLETSGDGLSLVASTSHEQPVSRRIQAKITMPSLQFIKAVGDSRLYMEKFEQDSLKVLLLDSVSFTGKRNKVNFLFFQTGGKAQIQFSQDPNKL